MANTTGATSTYTPAPIDWNGLSFRHLWVMEEEIRQQRIDAAVRLTTAAAVDSNSVASVALRVEIRRLDADMRALLAAIEAKHAAVDALVEASHKEDLS
jgi:hypothetical protein